MPVKFESNTIIIIAYQYDFDHLFLEIMHYAWDTYDHSHYGESTLPIAFQILLNFIHFHTHTYLSIS